MRETERAGRRRWARPPRSQHVMSEKGAGGETAPAIRTALTVTIFPRKVLLLDRRRESLPGRPIGVLKDPFPLLGTIGWPARRPSHLRRKDLHAPVRLVHRGEDLIRGGASCGNCAAPSGFRRF